jgi:multidrug efflux system membrane fusion protein
VKPFWIVFVVIAAAAGGGYYWWNQQATAQTAAADAAKTEAKSEGKGKGKKGRGGPINVRVITPQRQAMPVLIDALGTVESEHRVAVHPQISGVLNTVHFKEGDYGK